MRTPSAPASKACRINRGSIRPVQFTLMTLRFGGIVILLVPAKSAPAYEHQLQQNANIRGSKDFLPALDFPLGFELVEDKRGPPLIKRGRSIPCY